MELVGVTLRCSQCGCAVEMVDDNGVVDPADGDRVEVYRCVRCGAAGTLTLPVGGRPIRSGCLSEGSA